jgi:histone deacetylase 6
MADHPSNEVCKVQAYQAPYWEWIRPGVIDMKEILSTDSHRLHDVAGHS